jgi:dTDP-4-amino-4,6-dideoxygalactose transaminase
MQKLLDLGISTRRGIMTAHRETAYAEYSKGIQLPVSEDVSDRSIIIPLYVPMPEEEIRDVIDKIKDILGK